MRTYIILGEDVPPVVARPGATIKGKLVYANGKPAPDIGIGAQDIDRSPMPTSGSYARTGKDGTYTLTGLSSGTFNIMVSGQPEEFVAAALQDVVATAGHSESVPNIVLTAGAIVDGRVTDADSGRPLPGVWGRELWTSSSSIQCGDYRRLHRSGRSLQASGGRRRELRLYFGRPIGVSTR